MSNMSYYDDDKYVINMQIWASKVPWWPQQSNPQLQKCEIYQIFMFFLKNIISSNFLCILDISCVYLVLNWRKSGKSHISSKIMGSHISIQIMESRIRVKFCKVGHPSTGVECLRVYTHTFIVYFATKTH